MSQEALSAALKGVVMTTKTVSLPRVGIVCDLLEENWPSMDLVGEMLFTHLQRDHSESITPSLLRPPLRRRFSRAQGNDGSFFKVDRFVNRFWDCPRWVRRSKGVFDLFHVVDHSYGHLVHHLPPGRTVVTCHDVDAFRCLLYPTQNHSSRLYTAMAKHVLNGLSKAAKVTCDSVATRDQVLGHGLLPAERVVVVPNGVHPTCSADPDPVADAEVMRLLGPPSADAVDILHVGSTIPRKRIDVLLQIFATLRREFPQARLMRVGGPFTAAQVRLIEQLKLRDAVVVLPFLDRAVLAALYRRAALVLQPSEREGFGLPVIEAMACGTPVVASDIPALREVGGEAVTYCQVADVAAWSESVIELLRERRQQPDQWSARRSVGLAQAAKFSWAEYTNKMVALYRELLES
jgi:glycosyltransferase involved in cell wall biosynthesis